MKYMVTRSRLWHDGVLYKRGDIIDTDYGTSTDLYYETAVEEKPKRKRRTKAEIEAEHEDS